MKSWIKQTMICTILLIIIWGAYFCVSCIIQNANSKEKVRKEAVSVDLDLLGSVEEIDVVDDKIVLSGWVLNLEAEISSISLILQPLNGEEADVFQTECFDQNIMRRYYMADGLSDEIGFTSEIDKNDIEPNECYEIQFWIEDKECVENSVTLDLYRKITTNEYFYNGELYSYNPNTFKRPDISDQEIIKVMDEGSLRAYDAENEIWIYQYERKLYYIMNMQGISMKEADVCVPVMPSTSREEMLPEDRRQYGFDHWGTFIEDMKYSREGILPYQVVVVDIEASYPITYITTGLYDNFLQMWKKSFLITLEKEGSGENE